jgi:hypothetical protein
MQSQPVGAVETTGNFFTLISGAIAISVPQKGHDARPAARHDDRTVLIHDQIAGPRDVRCKQGDRVAIRRNRDTPVPCNGIRTVANRLSGEWGGQILGANFEYVARLIGCLRLRHCCA